MVLLMKKGLDFVGSLIRLIKTLSCLFVCVCVSLCVYEYLKQLATVTVNTWQTGPSLLPLMMMALVKEKMRMKTFGLFFFPHCVKSWCCQQA